MSSEKSLASKHLATPKVRRLRLSKSGEAKEAEAEADLKAGRVLLFEDVTELLIDLETED